MEDELDIILRETGVQILDWDWQWTSLKRSKKSIPKLVTLRGFIRISWNSCNRGSWGTYD